MESSRRSYSIALVRMLALVALLPMLSVSQSSGTETADAAAGSIPEAMVRRADEVVVKKMGRECFIRYVRYEPENSKAYPPEEGCVRQPSSCKEHHRKGFYRVCYSFRMPEKPFVDEEFMVLLDLAGSVLPENPLEGVPDCARNPRSCEFSIDEQQAIQIATNAGLAKGLRSWKTSFHWYYGSLQRFVWVVSTTLREGRDDAEGDDVVIDANTGDVLRRSSWSILD